MKKIEFCEKRDGTKVVFEKSRIVNAINAAFEETGEGNKILAQQITESIMENLARIYQNKVPTIEEIQDLVVNTLIDYNFRNTVIAYITYREKRKMQRKVS